MEDDGDKTLEQGIGYSKGVYDSRGANWISNWSLQ